MKGAQLLGGKLLSRQNLKKQAFWKEKQMFWDDKGMVIRDSELALPPYQQLIPPKETFLLIVNNPLQRGKEKEIPSFSNLSADKKMSLN